MLTPEEIAKIAITTLDSKKAQHIKLLRTHDVTIIADYFVICTASSTTQLKTLTDEVEKILKQKGETPLRREGHRSGGWIILDYACVIVHLFNKEAREFYSLERLWGDAEEIELNSEFGIRNSE
jgi:ribosome-associated protein